MWPFTVAVSSRQCAHVDVPQLHTPPPAPPVYPQRVLAKHIIELMWDTVTAPGAPRAVVDAGAVQLAEVAAAYTVAANASRPEGARAAKGRGKYLERLMQRCAGALDDGWSHVPALRVLMMALERWHRPEVRLCCKGCGVPAYCQSAMLGPCLGCWCAGAVVQMLLHQHMQQAQRECPPPRLGMLQTPLDAAADGRTCLPMPPRHAEAGLVPGP